MSESAGVLWPPLAATLWFVGLLLATFGPIPLAFLFWWLSKKAHYGWLLHFIYPPAAVLLIWFGADAIFYASGDTGDGPPGNGLLLVPAFLIFAATVAIYFVGLVAMWVRISTTKDGHSD